MVLALSIGCDCLIVRGIRWAVCDVARWSFIMRFGVVWREREKREMYGKVLLHIRVNFE